MMTRRKGKVVRIVGLGVLLFLLGAITHLSAQPAPWQVQLPVTINGNPYLTLYLGMQTNATNNFDVGIDDAAPPPTPAGDTVYFSSITGEPAPYDKLAKDYRASANAATTWRLRMQPAEGSQMVISWNVASFPTGWTFTYQEADNKWNGTGQIYSMSTSTAISFEGDGTVKRYLIVATPIVPASISGTISYSGTKTGTINIGLFTSPNFSGEPAYGTSIQSPGNYQVTGINPGTYYAAAFMDSNGSGQYDPDVDPVGQYSQNPITLSAGQSKTGVNITLQDPVIPKVATPVFSPASGTTFTDQLQVTISCSTVGATIRYTTDGSEPNENSPVYTGAITITQTTTIKAKAFKAGMTASDTASATYNKVSPQPASISGTISYSGTKTGTINIGLFTSPNFSGEPAYGTSIQSPGNYQVTGINPGTYYAAAFMDSNGSGQYDPDVDPVGQYSQNPITLSAGQSKTGVNITLQDPVIPKVATPVFSPASGTTFTDQLQVTISCSTVGATIRYTTDGSEPNENSPVYTGAITITQTTTIKAKAFKAGMTASDTASATYSKKVATPVFSPASGTTFTDQLQVTITCATVGAEIRYTTDGSEPNENSPVFTGAITITQTTTIKAKAFKAGMTPSTIATAIYYTGQQETGLKIGDTAQFTMPTVLEGKTVYGEIPNNQTNQKNPNMTVTITELDPVTIHGATSMVSCIFNVKVTNISAGGSADIVFDIPSGISQVFKYNPYTNEYYPFPHQQLSPSTRPGYTTVTITITDNEKDAQGRDIDLDPTPKVINDPIGMGLPATGITEVSGGGAGCFIATAAFGSYQEHHVWILRQFRDRYLLTNPAGRAFVKWYYKHSPKYASIIAANEALRAIVRILLLPVYTVAFLTLKLGIFFWLILAGVLLSLIRRWKMVKKGILILIAFSVLAVATPSFAYDFNLFKPATGEQNFVINHSSQVLEKGTFQFDSFYSFANKVSRAQIAGVRRNLIENQLLEVLGVSYGISDRFSLGIDFPVAIDQDTQVPDNIINFRERSAFGNVSVYGKYKFFGGKDQLGLAVVPFIGADTGDKENFVNADSTVLGVKIVVDRNWCNHSFLTFNIGFSHQDKEQIGQIEIDNALLFGIGFTQLLPNEKTYATIEITGRSDDGIFDDSKKTPIEALGSITHTFGTNTKWTIGIGKALTDGYSAPNFRIFTGLRASF
ncbi:MAG TPA: chitobiase/beta-hexosaminidase C-terminal domain-containing protein [bacterium]|nr:chitobiase/beta-hexosaminidase C-terminal domain-containing protein [bacterium]